MGLKPIPCILIICLLMISCGAPPEPGGEPEPAPDGTVSEQTPAPAPEVSESPEVKNNTVREAEAFVMESAAGRDHGYEYTEFNIGGGVYKSETGREMPYEIRGVMAVPDGDGPFPVVFIAHGCHESENEKARFDDGFDYLVKGLASNGYIAVSMDMVPAYIMRFGEGDEYAKCVYLANQHIQGVLSADKTRYPIDLEGKTDAGRVALLGHSRGGEAVFLIAGDQRERGVDIGAVISVAPTWYEHHDWPDVNAAILVPQYDGDVVSLDGFVIHDILRDKTDGSSSVTLLEGANHNFFNRKLTRDDSVSAATGGGQTIGREAQEDFLIEFATGVLDASLGGSDTFLNMSRLQPDRMYGRYVKRSVRLKDGAELIDAATGNGIASETAVVRPVADSWFFKHDEVLIDTVTRDTEYQIRNLISVEWETEGASVTVVPLIRDFGGRTSLGISLVADAASELNSPDSPPVFSVKLTDSAGNTATAVIPDGLNVFKIPPGKLDSVQVFDDTISFWTPASPLGMLNVPLSLFEGVELTEIETLELLFDRNPSGAIYISSILLQ